MKILNLTQHNATQSQIDAGVVDVSGDDIHELRRLLSFEWLPSTEEIEEAAVRIAGIAARAKLQNEAKLFSDEWASGSGNFPGFHHSKDGKMLLAEALNFKAMIGGAPFLMAPLERQLRKLGITPVYAFSKRVSVETTGENGEVVKTATFIHEGFVTAS